MHQQHHTQTAQAPQADHDKQIYYPTPATAQVKLLKDLELRRLQLIEHVQVTFNEMKTMLLQSFIPDHQHQDQEQALSHVNVTSSSAEPRYAPQNALFFHPHVLSSFEHTNQVQRHIESQAHNESAETNEETSQNSSDHQHLDMSYQAGRAGQDNAGEKTSGSPGQAGVQLTQQAIKPRRSQRR